MDKKFVAPDVLSAFFEESFKLTPEEGEIIFEGPIDQFFVDEYEDIGTYSDAEKGLLGDPPIQRFEWLCSELTILKKLLRFDTEQFEKQCAEIIKAMRNYFIERPVTNDKEFEERFSRLEKLIKLICLDAKQFADTNKQYSLVPFAKQFSTEMNEMKNYYKNALKNPLQHKTDFYKPEYDLLLADEKQFEETYSKLEKLKKLNDLNVKQFAEQFVEEIKEMRDYFVRSPITNDEEFKETLSRLGKLINLTYLSTETFVSVIKGGGMVYTSEFLDQFSEQFTEEMKNLKNYEKKRGFISGLDTDLRMLWRLVNIAENNEYHRKKWERLHNPLMNKNQRINKFFNDMEFFSEVRKGEFGWGISRMKNVNEQECFIKTLHEKFPVYKEDDIRDLHILDFTFDQNGFPTWEEVEAIIKEIRAKGE